MAIVLETTLGDLTIDLFVDERPRACLNFLKLCKIKYYNFNLFHTIQHDFLAQTGDPTGTGDEGDSIWGVLDGPSRRYFEGEDRPKIKHTNVGTVSLVNSGNGMLGSQFFITLAPELISLDDKHCVIGEVTEGCDVLRKLNEAICDDEHRPYQDVRITHTVILEDPFPDPQDLKAPSQSPERTAERLQGGRIGADEEIDETIGKTAEELAEMAAEREAKARATILEMVGDIPDAEMAPPENVLFVCKLNPVTNDSDLEIIFSRFGKIKTCEVIRDKQTGESLQYAFVEFEEQKSCEDAYFKMDNVLIDDRRIHVDFSQSVAKIKWLGKGRGVTYYDDSDKKDKFKNKDVESNRSTDQRSRHRNSERDETNYNRNKDDKNYSRNKDDKSYSRNHRDNRNYSRNYQDDRSYSRNRQNDRSYGRNHQGNRYYSRNHDDRSFSRNYQDRYYSQNHRDDRRKYEGKERYQSGRYEQESKTVKYNSSKRYGEVSENDKYLKRTSSDNFTEEKYGKDRRSRSSNGKKHDNDNITKKKSKKKDRKKSVSSSSESESDDKKKKKKNVSDNESSVSKDYVKKKKSKSKRKNSSSNSSSSSSDSDSDSDVSSERQHKKRKKKHKSRDDDRSNKRKKHKKH